MRYSTSFPIPAPVSAIGLGCGRLGSMMAGQTQSEMLGLIKGARDLGVSVFDTANIYGQGRSESLLGAALKGDNDVCIVTKAGQVFPLKQRLLAPLRGPASLILKRSSGMKAGLKAVRTQGLPRDFRPERLRQALTASLRRLRRDRVEIFLLHSPRMEHLADGAALDALAEFKRSGLAGMVGVSCDDADVLAAVCRDPRVEVVEAPFGVARPGMAAALTDFSARGGMVLAREILSAEAAHERPAVAAAVSFCVAHPAVAVTLVGTTKLDHLREACDVVA